MTKKEEQKAALKSQEALREQALAFKDKAKQAIKDHDAKVAKESSKEL